MRRGPLRALVAVLLWCALWWGGLSAHAAEALQFPPPALNLDSRAELPLDAQGLYWIDESGSFTADQVEAHIQELPWRPRRRDNYGSAHGAVLWILFDAVVRPGDHWFIEVGTAANNAVDLFYRDPSGAWVAQAAGTKLAVSRWSVPGRLPTFALARNQAGPVHYLLRVENENNDFLVPLALLRDDTLQEHREREQFLFGAYFGLLALIAVASLANGMAFGDRAFIAMSLYIVLLGMGQLARAGLGAQHIWRDWQVWNDGVQALWPGAAVAGGLWLIKIVTDPARLSRALDLAVWALIAATLAATALHVTIDTRTSMTLVLALTGVAIVAAMSMVLWGWMGGRDRHLALVALAFMPAAVLALFPLARALGLAPTTLLSRFGLFFGTVVELPILYYALNSRLTLRREAQLRASALSRTDPLTGLAHRRALVERLDSSLAHARGQKQNCALLGIRIANLEAIAEEFGRDAIDKVLVITASHLRRVAVGYDMVARVGERDFALLLEAPVTREVATSRAQQVVASGLRSVESLPGATLRFQVTVSLLPRPQLDGASSLQWVLEGLDRITPEERKMIRSLDSIH